MANNGETHLNGDNNGDHGDVDTLETREWLHSPRGGPPGHRPPRARALMQQLQAKASRNGVDVSNPLTTPYVNTIPPEQQIAFPGDRGIERKLKSIHRWNALAMVVKANKKDAVGGHIASYASCATLYEI